MLKFISKYFHLQWNKQRIVYQIMIDRFANNSRFQKNNDNCTPPPFRGGNIKGIINRLDYIADLGANSILLSPFFKSNAYHGYHCTTAMNEIEPQFGNEEDIQSFVKYTKRHKMTCGADFVPNHCHITNPIYVEHNDWFEFPNKEYKFYANIKDLPVLNLDHPEAREYMIKQALQLCEWGFDYIRIDHATGPSYSFLHELRMQVKRKYKNVRLIGEVVGEMDFMPLVCKRYNDNTNEGWSVQEARQSEYVGILDGVLDYEYYDIVKDALLHKTPINSKALRERVKKHFSRYPKNFELWLFLDNHDLDRILYYCKEVNKVKEVIDFTYSWKRPTIIYYGTEQGMKNMVAIHRMEYDDETVRQCMDWNGINHNAFKTLYPCVLNNQHETNVVK